MKGCIVQRSKGSWGLVVELGRDPETGKRRQQWVTVRGTKKEAERRLRELLHQLDTGGFVRSGKLTLGEFLQSWLKDYAAHKVRPSTFEGYRRKVRAYILPALGKVPLADLRPSNLQAFYLGSLDKGLSASTVSQVHRILSKVLSDAVRMELVARNVARAVTPPRPRRKEMRCLTQEEMLRLLKEAQSTPYYPVFYTALFTGLRRSELLGLRWRDLDLDMATLSVAQTLHSLEGGRLVFSEPKSQKGRRTVALSPSLAVLLRQHREAHEKARASLSVALKDDDLVFAWPDGKPMLPNSVTHAWQKLVNRLGLKGVRLHDTRHTHASLMLAQGVHPKIVSERLGHSTVALTLDVYSHVLPGLQEAAAKRFEEGLFTQPVSNPLAEISV